MLVELAAYTDISLAERVTDSLPLDIFAFAFRQSLTTVRTAVFLIEDLYSHQAAVKVIQKILRRTSGPVSAEDGPGQQGVEDAVHTFNDYLAIRGRLFKAEWDDEDERCELTSAIQGNGRIAKDQFGNGRRRRHPNREGPGEGMGQEGKGGSDLRHRQRTRARRRSRRNLVNNGMDQGMKSKQARESFQFPPAIGAGKPSCWLMGRRKG